VFHDNIDTQMLGEKRPPQGWRRHHVPIDQLSRSVEILNGEEMPIRGAGLLAEGDAQGLLLRIVSIERVRTIAVVSIVRLSSLLGHTQHRCR
jgi:hypothetical protein